MIVLDASVAVLALCADGEARRLVAEEHLAAPHLIDAEVAHALRSRVLRDEVDQLVAAQLLHTWGRLGVDRFAAVELLPRIWALRENLSAYDATYVALAEAMGCALVTADARLARAPGPTCPVTTVRG